MDTLKFAELAKHTLGDQQAFICLIREVDSCVTLEELHQLASVLSETQKPSTDLQLATIAYIGKKMAKMFLPEVKAVESGSDRDYETMLSRLTQYFDKRLLAAILASDLKALCADQQTWAVLHVTGVLLLFQAIGPEAYDHLKMYTEQ